jgi:hypothetical protein
MSEALEVRKRPETRSLKLPGPVPPLVAQRPAMPGEIPRAARSFVTVALAAGWSARAFFALGWRTDTGGNLTGELRASVLVRMRRGQERVSAIWETPWPIPAGIEPPGLDTPPVLADHLPRFPGMAQRVENLRQQRLALLKREVTVKWAYLAGVHWVRPAPPLGVIGGEGKSGWWSSTELKAAVTMSPR